MLTRSPQVSEFDPDVVDLTSLSDGLGSVNLTTESSSTSSKRPATPPMIHTYERLKNAESPDSWEHIPCPWDATLAREGLYREDSF
jgi:hypothetical protein